MRTVVRLESFLLVVWIFCVVSYAMKLDLSRFTEHRKPYKVDKRDLTCKGNPCPSDKPFLCKTSATCISLSYVCDDNYDCEDHFDENSAVCNAALRPPIEQIYQFLKAEEYWIIPKLFDGIDPEFVSHSLAGFGENKRPTTIDTYFFHYYYDHIIPDDNLPGCCYVTTGLDDLKLTMGLSDKAIDNIRTAFIAVEEGDERPLLQMGMPEQAWHQIQYMFSKLLKSGFKI